jgi:hypothetical protein
MNLSPKSHVKYTTNSVLKNLFSESNNRLASQEISPIVLNPKVQYHVHKSLPVISVLSYINPVHFLIPHFISARCIIKEQ